MPDDSDSTTDAYRFTVGTLVHTGDGPRPIESLAVGDWVLSQPEGTGEREHKRVTRIVNLRVHVGAYVNDGGFSDEYWEEIDKPIGWRRVDGLESHQLLETANGEMTRFGMFDRLWMTRDSGQGWIEANRDSTSGRIAEIRGGRATPDPRTLVNADFAGVDSSSPKIWTATSFVSSMTLERPNAISPPRE